MVRRRAAQEDREARGAGARLELGGLAAFLLQAALHLQAPLPAERGAQVGRLLGGNVQLCRQKLASRRRHRRVAVATGTPLVWEVAPRSAPRALEVLAAQGWGVQVGRVNAAQATRGDAEPARDMFVLGDGDQART
jgi:hypothetical protein